jgi:hypothetical protein
MNTIELFSGTKSFSTVAKRLGHNTYTIDNNPRLEPDYCGDVMDWENPQGICDVLWASPPCQGFSVAAIGRNWNHNGTPKTESAKNAMALIKRTIEIINHIQPDYWFIENPRGMLRKMAWFEDWVKNNGGVRHTVSYCQYGDSRQKPTDIWTNCLVWEPRPICKPGAKCHESAPRGSKTGTQGLKNAVDRGAIPPEIFWEIFDHITPTIK